MASRWRRWDSGFAVDILVAAEESEKTSTKSCFMKKPGKANFDMSNISIPKIEDPARMAVENLRNRPKSMGRGRNKTRPKDPLLLASQRLEERLNRPGRGLNTCGHISEQDWPSLSSRSASQNGGKASNLNATASNVVNTSEIVRESTCTKTGNLALKKNKESDKITSADKDSFQCTEVENKEAKSDPSLLLDKTKNMEDFKIEYLKELADPTSYILIDGAFPEDKSDLEETIATFGEVKFTKTYKQGKILVRMEDEMKCEWVISCIDGMKLGNSSESISALRVCDLIED